MNFLKKITGFALSIAILGSAVSVNASGRPRSNGEEEHFGPQPSRAERFVTGAKDMAQQCGRTVYNGAKKLVSTVAFPVNVYSANQRSKVIEVELAGDRSVYLMFAPNRFVELNPDSMIYSDGKRVVFDTNDEPGTYTVYPVAEYTCKHATHRNYTSPFLARERRVKNGFLGSVRMPIVNAFQNHPCIAYPIYWATLAATGYAGYKAYKNRATIKQAIVNGMSRVSQKVREAMNKFKSA